MPPSRAQWLIALLAYAVTRYRPLCSYGTGDLISSTASVAAAATAGAAAAGDTAAAAAAVPKLDLASVGDGGKEQAQAPRKSITLRKLSVGGQSNGASTPSTITI